MPPFALVTGASKRLGKAFAISLAEMGYDILLHYNSSEKEAKETEQIIEKTGRKCVLKQSDFRNDEDLKSLISGSEKKHLPEILVNNASNFLKSDLHSEGTEPFDSLFAVNFRAPYVLTKQFVRHCKTGLIINLLDTKINHTATNYPDYWLTKKTFEAFTRLCAAQFAPDIRVNGIAPGLILSPEGKPESYLQNLAKSIPLKKTGNVKNLTDTLAFLSIIPSSPVKLFM